MSWIDDFLEKKKKEFGVTDPSLATKPQGAKQPEEWQKQLREDFLQEVARLDHKDLRETFEKLVTSLLESDKYPKYQTVSDLRHYLIITKTGDFVNFYPPFKVAGKFNFYMHLHQHDDKQSYAVLECPELRLAHIKHATANTKGKDSEVQIVMNCLT